MKILSVMRDDTACGHYRVLQPLVMLKEHKLADCVLIDIHDDLGSEESYKKVLESDVVLIPRPSSEEWFDFFKAVRGAGKVLVADYDDDPFDPSPYNPFYRFTGIHEFEVVWPDGYREWLWKDGMKDENGEVFFNMEANISRRDMCRASFSKADLVTTTTSQLKEVFEKINPNTIILPNLIDLNLFPKAEMAVNATPRIGWQGGVSHFQDLEMLLPILKRLSKDRLIDFSYFGDHRMGQMFNEVPGYHHEQWVPNNVYPYKLKLLNLDIGLAPLVDTRFNRCKSAIKYFEYAAVGVPTIASNIPPYSDVITNMIDGMLVNTEDEWVEAMQMLISDSSLRKKLAKNAYENVYQNFNAHTKAHLWVDAYQKCLEKDKVVV